MHKWIAIAKDRPKWRQQAHSIPKPPGTLWLKGTSRVNDYNCLTQKDTQPNQACSDDSRALFPEGQEFTTIDSCRGYIGV